MKMSDQPSYTPPKVWTWNKDSGGKFASINRPISGATHEKDLPVGRHPMQLYSLATPNGVKVTVMLEELLALGHSGAEYDAWLINISEGDQFGSGFVAANPNSKIPALVDRSGPTPIRVFESGAILIHLAEKFGALLPTDAATRAECLSWLMWQMGSAPFLGGGSTRPVSSCRCRTTSTSFAGPTPSPSAPLSSAAGWSTARGASRRASSRSGTTPAISRRNQGTRASQPGGAA
jgi:hypothetical protein